MPFEFALSGRAATLDVGKARDLAEVRRAPGYLGFVRSLAETSDYDRFGAKVVSRDALRRLAEMATERPSRSGEDILVDAGHAVDAGAYYDAHMATVALARSTLVDDAQSGRATSRPGFVRALLRTLPNKPTLAEVAGALREDVVAALEAMPRSDWRRAIPSQARVEMVHVPDLEDEDGPDSVSVRHFVEPASALPWTVVPDDAFARFLRMVNVSSDEYADALVASGYPDPRSSGAPAGPSGSPSAPWAGFRVHRDMDIPQALRPSEVVAVVGQSPHGGAPVLVARLRLQDLMARDATLAVAVVEGGMVGLHDFRSNTGHVEPPADAVVMRDMLSWRVPAKGVSFAKAHQVSDDFLDAAVVDAEPRSEWTRTGEHEWRRPGPDGGSVTVAMLMSEAREEEFWVQTVAPDGLGFGPQETAEVWPDLDAAKESGDALAALQWGASAPSP